MATGTEAYNHSVGGVGTIGGVGAIYNKGLFVISRRMKAADIIAADATLTAAAKIAAGQEITVCTLPEGFLILGVACTIITPGTSSGTINIGTYANTTAFDAAVAIDAAAGTRTYTTTDAGGMAALSGTLITSTSSNANKVCVEYIADETTGEFLIQVFGIDLSDVSDV